MMVYAHILKVLHRNLRQTATQLCVHRCYVVHTHRTLSTAPAFVRLGSKVSSLDCLAASQRHQVASVHCTARSRSSPEDRGKSVSRYQSGTPTPSAAQKVKEAGRDFTYLIVVLIGLGVTGGLLYVVFQELFSSSSPNKVYSRAFDIVKSHPEVIGAFGEPIKCYGETTRRGRRQQVRHTEYMKDGLKHMRVKFYIEGSEPGLKGTVHSESKENAETGKYEFRYIFVDVDTYPRRSIIVEDNR
ncbi:mitochondrial import inner membrane translocase subunit Tim21 [Poecilia latipinna]|uniref:Mitochondrial import inner membrane translocase subunit Tim21 n=2 Tax=Poecilia TaxID=8080 RepID=A0A087X4B2_POEFO|nr:PREDICTED: mitochondrial import inner membrane translocase subunit Tim21 [Poecilia formosa]XP_014875743.1 PREDICTED: mitochondrial import inner membrane translocase subunit Tim21 [Poecilia latipinna]XP_014875745.1 PREDICTED: mitochondrial import inner membrane translocase subunit Tim21 [Poecilia latipinna]XP_016524826.1 PREDICTED: mitochondrial import inner membrane translocase subunit Tim21 [Poecilia formosa]